MICAGHCHKNGHEEEERAERRLLKRIVNLLCRQTCVLEKLRDDFDDFRQPTPEGWFDLQIGPVELKHPKGKDDNMMTIHLTNEQQIRVTLAPKTSKGKPAKIDGKPEWTKTSGDSEIEVAEDGLSALLVSADKEGESVFHVEADADLGEGTTTIAEDITVSISEPAAASLALTVGEAEDKPETAPAIASGAEPKPKAKKKH